MKNVNAYKKNGKGNAERLPKYYVIIHFLQNKGT